MTTAYLMTPAGLALAAILALAPPAAADLEVHTEKGVSYVSGGVGDDERQALKAMSDRFNLKVLMALESGHFVSNATVRVEDSQGQTVLDTVADGPLLLVQLKPGTYTVTCSLGGKELRQRAHVTAGAQQQLVFRWRSE